MCGLFGFLKYSSIKIDEKNLTESLAAQAAVRGTDAAGVAYNNKGNMEIIKRPENARRINFRVPNIYALIGHTRHATQGAVKLNYNNHPFIGRAGKNEFALAHNGVIMNDKQLRDSLKLPNTKIETDSYIAVQLIESRKKLNMKSIAYMAEQVQGSFSFSIMDKQNNIYLVKGDSPLCILHFPKRKLYVYASTDDILWKALIDTELFADLKRAAYKMINIHEGDILKICSSGRLEHGSFKYSDYCGYDCDWRSFSVNEPDSYYSDLVSAASGMGITASEIDELLSYGLTYDEIEEYIYSGMEV
ncbi:MAG: class II glutamine amidotransferase [Monoglobales bacterium]